MQDGLCTLAMCLYMEKQNRDLEKLLPTTYTDESSIDSHMWIVLAFVCFSNSNYSKALCLAQKVCSVFFENVFLTFEYRYNFNKTCFKRLALLIKRTSKQYYYMV